jgi:hypothetical protein
MKIVLGDFSVHGLWTLPFTFISSLDLEMYCGLHFEFSRAHYYHS